MNNEENAFDVMAAAEQTAAQLDLMIRQVPSHIKSTLSDEWRKLPLLVELPKATKRMEEVIEEMRESVELLKQTIWLVTIADILLATAIPFIAWLVMNW